MHLLFADPVADTTIAELERRGHRCSVGPALSTADLPARIAGVDGLVVRSTAVDRAVFEAADRLALVIRAGAGTNTIDIDVAARTGVLVCNVPGRNAVAVAELTLGLILALDRRIADNAADARRGRWAKATYAKAAGLLGSTLGIVGMGAVGLAVAERAAAFGMRIACLERVGRSRATRDRLAELGVAQHGSLAELLAASDVVSLHVPASAGTRNLVDAGFLAAMRPGALLVNTSRGDVVDEAALLAALDAGHVRAGLDVFADEPGSGSAAWDSPLARHPAVVATHHIGASTAQAQAAVAAGVVEIVDAFVAGEAAQLRQPRAARPRQRHAHRPAPRPGRRAGHGAGGPAQGRAQRRAHAEPGPRRRRGGRRHPRRRRHPARRPAGRPRGGPRGAGLLARRPRRRAGGPGMTRGGTVVTHAAPAPARGVQVVRPFAGWLVRAEAAADEVGPMAETALAARWAPRPVRAGAYEPLPPSLYVYRQRTPHGEHSGIVCDIAHEAFLDGRARGHESVHPGRVDGLAQHLASGSPRVELVSTLHRSGPVALATLARAPDLPPTRDVTGPDGARHTVWRLPEGPQTDALCRELGAVTHYIADGHHRVAAGLQVWGAGGGHPGRGVACVAYPLDGLRLAAFGRRVAGPVDAAAVLGLLDEGFDVHPVAGAPEAPASGIAVHLDRRWYVARHRGERPPGSAGLDVSLLHARVLDRLPAGTAAEPTRDPVEALVAACAADGGALFVPPAPELGTITAIADAGEVVPAKSTFFSPKPGSGLFLRGPAA